MKEQFKYIIYVSKCSDHSYFNSSDDFTSVGIQKYYPMILSIENNLIIFSHDDVQVVVPAVAEDQISEETVVQAEEQAAATEEVALEAKSEPEDFQASISRGHIEQIARKD